MERTERLQGLGAQIPGLEGVFTIHEHVNAVMSLERRIESTLEHVEESFPERPKMPARPKFRATDLTIKQAKLPLRPHLPLRAAANTPHRHS